MFSIKTLFSLITWCGLLCLVIAQEECGKCLKNNAYCLNGKDYKFCLDGENPFGQIRTCEGELQCSDDIKICVDPQGAATTIKFPCGQDGACNAQQPCASPGLICLSPTEAGFCSAANENPILVPCADGQLCSANLYEANPNQTPRKICAPQVVLDFFGYKVTCGGVSTTTPSPGSSTTVDDTLVALFCAQENESTPTTARYFYMHFPGDTVCHQYIYCEKTGNNGFRGVVFTCPSNGYWDITTNRCQDTKPSSCTVSSTSTSSTTTTQRPSNSG